MRKGVAIGRWAIPLLFSWNLVAAESTPSAPASGAPHGGETLVFVGRLISIQEVPPEACRTTPDGMQECPVPFDQGYRARYKVLQRISGRIDGDEVPFTAYSHHGFPAMALHPQALLFVARRDGESFLHRYQG